ncbi:MAG: hypothetical protein CL905_02290 [Dehalococcoidia bacterium]|nr:hypothetical protein [Dehalococcoidia bacterium]
MNNEFRLQKSIVPSHYSIFIEPDLINESFSGNEEISISVLETTKSIKINSIGLVIGNVKLTGNIELNSTKIEEDKKHETITIHFKSLIDPGDYNLKIQFSGKLDNSLRGFYLSKYRDNQGIEHKIGTTQFESTDARRAFPCFDEPEFKSVFSISLKLDQSLMAISNSPIESEITNSEGKKTIIFKDTIKMSTYLVAFIIGPFEESETAEVNNVPIKIISVKGKRHLSKYALNCGKFFLDYFNNYYGINYPGSKLDLIAVPDFASGAMENFGCITFRESLLLVDETRATESELTRIADVIAHEIAHMWFGDLVTMKWWNGIWLNEAFATFMATKAVDKFNPDWERWVQFGFERSAAFDVDSLEETRPIEYEVISPDDASGMFDLLTYEKGGSVLRMLEQYLWEQSFQNGVKKYLKIHQYSNTDTKDLWESLEKSTNEPVEKTMESWIFQPGFPQLMVSEENNSLKLEQNIFKYENTSNKNQVWKIPIVIKSFTESDKSIYKTLMEENKKYIDLNNSPDIFHLVNVGGDGFYRIQYSNNLLTKILKNLNPEKNKLTNIERFCLLDDYWSDILSCNKTVDVFLEDLQFFKEENDPEVLNLIISCLSFIDKFVDENHSNNFKSFSEGYFSHLLKKYGFKNNNNDTNKIKEFKAALIRGLGNICADEKIINYCGELFETYRKNPKDVEANALAATISVLSNNGDSNLYNEFLELYLNSSTPQDEMRFLFALSSFQNIDNFINTLELSLSEKVRTQNAPYLLGQTLRNKKHFSVSWDFIENNWDKINDKFPENSIPRLLTGIRAITDVECSEKIKTFLKNNKVPQGQKTVDQHLEKLNINVKFADFNLKYLEKFLLNNN